MGLRQHMKEREALPDADHVAHHCKGSEIDEGVVLSSAFELRHATDTRPEETELSVNWLEFFKKAERAAAVDEIRKIIQLELKASARFAVFNVGSVRKQINDNPDIPNKIDVLYMPEDDDPSHAGVVGYVVDDLDVAAELALLDIELFPAKID